MEETAKRKKSRRKVRCTQDFNQYNRISLLNPAPNSEFTTDLTKSVTKKKQNLFYLPQIDLNLSGSKENCSPNILGDDIVKKSKKSRRKLNSSEEMKLEISEIQPGKTRNGKLSEGTSPEDDKRDSEVEFKKKRRRKRKSKRNSDPKSSSETSSVETEALQEPTDLLSNNNVVSTLDEIQLTEGNEVAIRKSNRFSQSVPKIYVTEEFDSPQKINGKKSKHKNTTVKCLGLQRSGTFVRDTPTKNLVTKTPKRSIVISNISVSFDNTDRSLKRKSSISRKSEKFDQNDQDIINVHPLNNTSEFIEDSSENIETNIRSQKKSIGVKNANSNSKIDIPSKRKSSVTRKSGISPVNGSSGVKLSEDLVENNDENVTHHRKSISRKMSVVVQPTPNKVKVIYKTPLKSNDTPNNVPSVKGSDRRSSCFRKSVHQSPIMIRREEQNIEPIILTSSSKKSLRFSNYTPKAINNEEKQSFDDRSIRHVIEPVNISSALRRSISFSHVPPKIIRQEEQSTSEPSITNNKVRASKSILKKSNNTKMLDDIHETRKSTRNSSVLKRKSSSVATGSFALTPLSQEYISDDVFTSGENLCETMDIAKLEDVEKNGDTYELQNSTFEISELPVATASTEEIGRRRSKSLCGTSTISNRKSVSFMTPNLRPKRKTSELQAKSLNTFENLTFNEESNGSLLWGTQESSKIYPKSPHFLKVSSIYHKNSEIPSDIDLRMSKSLNKNSDLYRPPSYNVCKKRKQWNRSLGVSILDDSGVLHTISPPWENTELDISNSLEPESDSPKASLSPIKQVDSTKKSFINSTKKLQSTKKVQMSESHISPIKSKILFTEIISPIKKETQKQIRFDESNEANTKTKSAVKRTKLPNFALIHQKAYEKLENLKEMSERKAIRAQQLLSGKKPTEERSLCVPTSNLKVKSPTFKIKSPKSRKLLRYSPKKAPMEKPKKLDLLTANMVVSKIKTKITPSKSNAKIVKPVEKKAISKIPKALPADKKGLSKLGFKAGSVGNAKASRVEQLKAAANKTQPKRNSLENRRDAVQKVRTNRRFELLMKMRNNQA